MNLLNALDIMLYGNTYRYSESSVYGTKRLSKLNKL